LTFYLDTETLNKKFKNRLFYLILEDTTGSFDEYNIKKTDKIELPNNHLQYALTWYSLCFVLIITFLIYKKKNEIL